jgi:hypothetical protein
MKTSYPVRLASGAADARDLLRLAIPELERLVNKASDADRELALRAKDLAAAACGKLVLALKGRA